MATNPSIRLRGVPGELITLEHSRAPGDILVMTAFVRDLALSHPGRFRIKVKTPFRQDVWANNPYIDHEPGDAGQRIRLDYGASIRLAGKEKVHFLSGFHRNFEVQTGIAVPLRLPHPDLHLTEEVPSRVDGRYWVMLSGGKSDFTTKHWNYRRHQEVCDALLGYGIPVVQAGGAQTSHTHPKLIGAKDLVGKTSIRELFHLIKNADGVICTITMAMHAAAALGRPCVVTGGGREEWWWEGYHRTNPAFGATGALLKTDHRYLHTLGLLQCCASKGCWTNKLERKDKERSVCHDVVTSDGGQKLPRCQHMITTDKVIESVLSYYYDGTLAPLGKVPMDPVTADTEVTTRTGDRITLTVRRTLVDPKPVVVPPPPPAPAPTPAVVPAPTVHALAPRVRPVELQPASAAPFFTAFVLTYGEFPDMHRRCLSAICRSTSHEDVELRVFQNALGPISQQVVNETIRGRAVRVYQSDTNRHKYPVMREMFRDPDAPIRSPWVLWFDDDSFSDVNPNWLRNLKDVCRQSVARDPMVGMVGAKFFFSLKPGHAQWVRSAGWYKGKKLRDRLGKPADNGDKVHFVTGGFWAMRTQLIQECDIPDARLQHNGGDVAIGEQVYQAGYTLVNWNSDKKQVMTSGAARRGTNQGALHWVM